MSEINIGDTFTIENVFKKRTFWQWLLRKPKKIMVFEVTHSYSSDAKNLTLTDSIYFNKYLQTVTE